MKGEGEVIELLVLEDFGQDDDLHEIIIVQDHEDISKI